MCVVQVGLRDLLRGCLSGSQGSSLAAARYRKQRTPSFRLRSASSGASLVVTTPTGGGGGSGNLAGDSPVVPSSSGDGVAITDVSIGEASEAKSGQDVFVALYTTWSHSPIATFSLCLLAQAYELACSLVSKLYVSALAMLGYCCVCLWILFKAVMWLGCALQCGDTDHGRRPHASRQVGAVNRIAGVCSYVSCLVSCGRTCQSAVAYGCVFVCVCVHMFVQMCVCICWSRHGRTYHTCFDHCTDC